MNLIDLFHEGDEHVMDADHFMDHWTAWPPGSALMLVGIAAYALVTIWIAVFLYKDSLLRVHDNPGVWALLGLLFSVVALFVYLLVRNAPREAYQRRSPQSGHPSSTTR
ncbi:MAG: hypothetical protein Kow0069_14630 [Promethearchaeota archaeon]